MNNVVSSTTGNLALTGDTGVTHTSAGDLTTGGAGTIDVTATANDITMADGTIYTAGSGTVTLTAANSVLLGEITTGSSAINVTATAGSITDNTAAETANLTTTGTATLAAATGIGSAGGAADIDTTLGTLVATNNTSGNIDIQETSGLIIGGTGVRTLGGNGNINVDVVAGAFDINSVVTANGSGNVTLHSGGLLTVANDVRSTTGLVDITSTGLTINSLRTVSSQGSLRLDAGTGSLTNSGIINNGISANAPITLIADDMVLSAGTISAGSAKVNLFAKTDTQAITVGDGSVGFGSGTMHLDQSDLVTISTSGGLNVGDVNPSTNTHTAVLTVGDLTLNSPTGVTGGGLHITNNGDVKLVGKLIYKADNSGTNHLNISSTNSSILGGGSELVDTANPAQGDIVLTASKNIGKDIADPLHPVISTIHIGNIATPTFANMKNLQTTSNNHGDIYVNIAGPLNLAQVSNIGGTTHFVSTGAITQSGEIRTHLLAVKTLNDLGAAITLCGIGVCPNTPPGPTGNYVDILDIQARNALDTLNANGKITFYQPGDYNVQQAVP